MNISIVVNPYARKNFNNPKLIDNFRDIIGKKGSVKFSQNLDDLESLIREIKKESPEYIGISGGDGTLMHTISRIIRVYEDKKIPPILILKGGTMNMVANSLKLKGSQLATLERFYLAYNKNIKTEKRDLININNYYCFIFGMGIVSNFLSTYYDGPGTGPVKAAQVTGKLIGSAVVDGPYSRKMLDPIKLKLEINNESFPEMEVTAILSQTIENLGIGFKPMYRAMEKEGTFHSYITTLKINKILKFILPIFFGTPIRDKGFIDKLTYKMKIEGNKTFNYTLDGELFESETSNLILKHGKTLNFVVV